MNNSVLSKGRDWMKRDKTKGGITQREERQGRTEIFRISNETSDEMGLRIDIRTELSDRISE